MKLRIEFRCNTSVGFNEDFEVEVTPEKVADFKIHDVSVSVECMDAPTEIKESANLQTGNTGSPKLLPR